MVGQRRLWVCVGVSPVLNECVQYGSSSSRSLEARRCCGQGRVGHQLILVGLESSFLGGLGGSYHHEVFRGGVSLLLVGTPPGALRLCWGGEDFVLNSLGGDGEADFIVVFFFLRML